MIAAIGPTTPVTQTTANCAATSSSPLSSPSLLPAPAAAAIDPLSMMYLIESRDEQLGLAEGTKRTQGLQQEEHQQYEKEAQAIQQQDKAAKHKSFWEKVGSICGDVAKVAGVVASVAAAVATCGVASPLAAVAIAGAVLSTAGFADSELGVLKRLGVSADLAGILDTGMSIAGAATSVGAGLLSGGQAAASTASTVGKVAAGVAGVGQVGSAVATVGSSFMQRDEDKADAREVSAEAQQDSLHRLVARLLRQTQDADQQDGRALQTISAIKKTQSETSLIAATGGREGIGS